MCSSLTVWEIVSRNEPHEDEDQLMIGAKIRDSAYTPIIPNECDPTLAELLKMCWRADPTERPVSIFVVVIICVFNEYVDYDRNH